MPKLEPSATIINLSCLQRPIRQTNFGFASIPTKGVNAFVELCQVFSRPRVYCGMNFSSISNPLWVAYQYTLKLPQIINPYKLGNITSSQFIQNLRQTFSFITHDSLKTDRAGGLIDEIKQNHHHYLTLKSEHGASYSPDKLIDALIERAWNALIEIDDIDGKHLNQIYRQARANQPIYLISNTNELNVHVILSKLADACDQKVEASQSVNRHGLNMIQLFKNKPVFLVPSYLNHQFKADANSTPGLMRTVIDKLALQPGNTKVVSQYQGDLSQAAALGVPEANRLGADQYFEPSSQHTAKRKVA